jgi:hypothetical protein
MFNPSGYWGGEQAFDTDVATQVSGSGLEASAFRGASSSACNSYSRQWVEQKASRRSGERVFDLTLNIGRGRGVRLLQAAIESAHEVVPDMSVLVAAPKFDGSA